jgi:multidrug efflux pump subunit AcrA (membrane-fusion protein)/YHS domain-containing protein
MKKFLYPILTILIIVGSFWAGSWYSQRKAVKVDPSAVKSIPVTVEEEPETDTSSMAPGTVRSTPERQQAIGVRLGVVEKKPVTHTLRILGRVAADETKIYRINASVDGWIKETFPNSVGSLVKKDEVLATFYSPQFLDAEQGYLYALGTVERLGPGRRLELGRKEAPNPAALDPYVVQRQIDVLRGMGMGDTQIEEVGRTRQITQDIKITAPADGFVIARNVSPEQRFLKGTELYRIADLSRVWILADVFEHEARYFKPGVKAKVHLPHQKRTYHATVSEALPIFDPTTRTLKVRLETDNPEFVLRPDMFVDVELPISLPPAVTVPADAVLDSGLKKTVFVDRGNGFFEPLEVETGWHIGNRVEIVKGLKPGERIVISGNFLIDSESRLELAAAGMVGTLSKDPVCGVDVSINKAEKAGRKSTYQGKTYYFSSNECKEKFEKNPSAFVKE